MIMWFSDNGEEYTVIFYNNFKLIFIEELLWYFGISLYSIFSIYFLSMKVSTAVITFWVFL